MQKVRYDFPEAIKGDTFNGVQFTVAVNNSPINLTSSIVRMSLRLTPTGESVLDLTSVGNAGITISDSPENGIFTVNRQIISVSAGIYKYDIQIELADGTIKTYIYGNWNISQDITND